MGIANIAVAKRKRRKRSFMGFEVWFDVAARNLLLAEGSLEQPLG